MQDPLTDLPPPSRLHLDDLNNFATPNNFAGLPSPFMVWAPSPRPHPKLVVVAISKSGCHLLHNFQSKRMIGSLVLPEVPMSSNALQPSLQDKSCVLYALDDDPAIVLISVQYSVATERSAAWAKTLLREIQPEKVLVLSSIPSQHFRGKLSADETLVFKLETLAQRLDRTDSLGEVPYFPSGSMVDGVAAALLTQCQIRKLKGRLLVSWPEYDAAVVHLLNSLLKRVSPALNFDAAAKEPLFKPLCVDSELYT